MSKSKSMNKDLNNRTKDTLFDVLLNGSTLFGSPGKR